MAETLLGVVAAALGLGALAFTLTHRAAACFWSWYTYPSGAKAPEIGLAPPAITAPAILLGSGALLVLLGAVVDARLRVPDYRILSLAMLLTGAVFCVFADLLASSGSIWVSVGRSPANDLQCAQLTPHAGQVNLGLIYTPVMVVAVLCALVALARHESWPASIQDRPLPGRWSQI